jgi:uncharacterized membrane protein YqjE
MEQTAKFSDTALALKGLWLNLSHIIGEITAIAKLETRIASMSLVAIFIMLLLSSFLCLAIWLCGLSALCIWLFQLGFSWPAVLLQAAGLNVLLLVILGLAIKRCSKNLAFSATRRQLSRQPILEQERLHESTQETNTTA